jgi:O-antigen/teichoic acid export membrane protein
MTVVLAARLGVTGLGEYALVSAVVFVANVATTFGTDMVLVRRSPPAAGSPAGSPPSWCSSACRQWPSS